MLIKDGFEICKRSINIEFSKLFSDIYINQEDIRKNKGKVGQMMEKKCGLELSNTITDFKDGDLKTIKMGERYKESSFALTMLNSWIDKILQDKILPFQDTRLHKKTENFILMFVNKDDKNALNWFFRKCSLYNASQGTPLYNKLKSDYYAISQKLKKCLQDPSKMIHTTDAGKDSIIQIRTKGIGKGKDKSIYSNVFKRNITNNQSLAFYIKRVNFLKFNNENIKYE